MSAPPATAASGLASALVHADKLQASEVEEMLAKAPGHAFIDALVASGRISARALAEFAAYTYSLALADLDSIDPAALPIEAIDAQLARSARVLPLRLRRNRIILAIADPSDIESLDKVRNQTGLAIEASVGEVDKLTKLIARALAAAEAQRALIEPEITAAGEPDVDDAPVARFVQKLLSDAVGEGASALHFEPQDGRFRIRIRVAGALRDWVQPPVALKGRIIRRLKSLANLDPQDRGPSLRAGRASLTLASGPIELRVSIVPTVRGEKLVLELAASPPAPRALDALGLDPVQVELVRGALDSDGLVLICGAPRNGKTTTLYSLVAHLDEPGLSIFTIEDPVRAELPGINQVEVDVESGRDYPSLLEAVLRHDTDVLALGSLGDAVTAKNAVKAARNGHLVIARMHAADATDALGRLVALGVPSADLVSTVKLVTTQRLARRLCECKSPDNVSDETLLLAGFSSENARAGWRPYRPVGCERCKGTGYLGRLGMFHAAPCGVDTGGGLRESGLSKVREGIISLAEITDR